MADKENLLLLLDHPTEPVFMDKGVSVFDIPAKFLTDRYAPLSDEIQSRFSANTANRIPVKDIPIPDLTIAESLDSDEPFSLFIPQHRKLAHSLIDIFMNADTLDDLQSIAVYARDRVNPLLFNYALSVAILHRPDTTNLEIPSLAQHFPEKFLDSKVFRRVREEATVVPEGSRQPIVVPRDYTASDLEPEHRLWYFREDMGVNMHHWHWHLVYPFEGDRSIVVKDRRGELFYYVHQQMLARYNVERFSNLLARTIRFNNFREPIVEGYFPKMDSLVASRAWPPRFANVEFSDLKRETEQISLDISDLERWRDRIFEAIHQGHIVDDNGEQILLDDQEGIDILGNILESSILSKNRMLYGDLHNMGHVFSSYIHDPDERHLEKFAVMGDVTTAMRDPFFYKWHAFIDDIFQEHKAQLKPYTEQQLSFDGISIIGVKLKSDGEDPNILHTFWQESDLNLARGMDFVPRGNVYARFTHLQHTPFSYVINIKNDSGAQRLGYVRIFLAPKRDERRRTLLFPDQRLLLIELDKFQVALNPGPNTIRRRSKESNVTIPFEQTYRYLADERPVEGAPDDSKFNYCGCGWPDNLLIPKGWASGMPCELFVMVSNFEEDGIQQNIDGTCSNASAFCGIRNRLYPDKRAMGYPFDRPARAGVDRLSNFLTANMSLTDVVIRHEDKVLNRKTDNEQY